MLLSVGSVFNVDFKELSMIKIGYLSPRGELFECPSWGHLQLAKELCKEIFCTELKTDVECEKYLLNSGFLCIQMFDILGKENLTITQSQKNWLEDQYIGMNNSQREGADNIIKNSY